MKACAGIDGLTERLTGTRFAAHGHVHDRLESTNDALAELARSGAPEGTFVVAAEQTAGRGRRGDGWESDAGLGLYLSALFRPRVGPPIRWTLGAAVAACDACRESGAVNTTIKWPNDLLAGGRKLAGILVDTRTTGASIRDLVVGLGVNVHHDADRLRELDVPATSLRVECPAGWSGGRADLAEAFLRRMETVALRIEAGDWEAVAGEWLERSPSAMDAAVAVQPRDGKAWRGVSAGLEPDGALRVRDSEGGLHRVHQVDRVRFEEVA